jgi:diguanylate cyclase (GGDEF)-like protein/PAS domain S-box-containing protein
MSTAKILVVDDNPNNRLALRTVLKGVRAEVHEAANGLDALSMALEEQYAMILLDVQMPEMDGFEVCEQLRADPRTANTPILFLTAAFKEVVDKVRGYVAGATDYLEKPIEDHIVKAKVQVFLRLYEQQHLLQQNNDELRVAATVFESQEGMVVTDSNGIILRVNRAFTKITGFSAEDAIGQNPRILKSGIHDSSFYVSMWDSILHRGGWAGEIWNRRKLGEAYAQYLTITPVLGPDGKISNYVGTFTDATDRIAAAEKIERLAFYDALTQLPNRRLMMDRLERALTTSTRSNRFGALMLLDMDNFKTLNDTLGHDVGDQFLVEVATRIKNCIREGDTAARMGGDEFVVILEHLDRDQQAAVQATSVAVKIQALLNQPYLLQVGHKHEEQRQRSHQCTSSIGITLFCDQSASVEELVKRADTAMYQAKEAGRNTFRFFDPAMQEIVVAKAILEEDLRKAIAEGQFVLHYQAQVDNESHVVGTEALVRWRHPTKGMVSPAAFIPLAEETSLILPLGHWVMEAACAQLALWDVQPDMQHLSVAVNVSARQFSLPNFVPQVLALMERHHIRPYRLKLELTESLLLKNTDDVIAKMIALKECGVDFSLDDFGTGYSSLSYLKRLPLDQLKIDQSFVRDVLTDASDAAIARAVIALGKSLGLGVIAEGVETQEQRNFLADNGCTFYQGYFFSRPVPLHEFEALVHQQVAATPCQPAATLSGAG